MGRFVSKFLEQIERGRSVFTLKPLGQVSRRQIALVAAHANWGDDELRRFAENHTQWHAAPGTLDVFQLGRYASGCTLLAGGSRDFDCCFQLE
jgi:hypothetical protein